MSGELRQINQAGQQEAMDLLCKTLQLPSLRPEDPRFLSMQLLSPGRRACSGTMQTKQNTVHPVMPLKSYFTDN